MTIEAGAACARFTGAVIRNVRIGPSPEWLARRLAAAGLRSISNVVDATNYVMLELGQPLHAYDLARVPGPALSVRRSRPGETLVTLDGVKRALPEGTTIVADGSGPSGIGGVMGGQSSEVGDATTDVFLESAWWHPAPLRRTRKALGLVTDAAHRFERGTDLWGVTEALARCIDLVLLTAGGALDGEPIDLWPEPETPHRIFLRHARVAQVLGTDLPVPEVERCLTAVGAVVSPKPEERRYAVQVPGWRPDLREEIDLIEEIARVHGYPSFPDQLQPFRAGNQTDAPIAEISSRIRRHMVAEGLFEVILLPVGPLDQPPGPPPPGREPGAEGRAARTEQVRILNPISADHGFLRRSLLPGLSRQVEANWSNQVRDVRLFEIGTGFAPGRSGPRPLETVRLAGVITGARWPAHWTDPKEPGSPGLTCDIWDLKGLFERAVLVANPGASVQVEGDGWTARDREGLEVGRAGPLPADAPPWAAPLFGFEIVVDPAMRPSPRYVPLPVFPPATRDLALVLSGEVTAALVEQEIRGAAGPLLESVRVIDEYRGPGVPAGQRSLAVRLVLRSPDRTLRDAEVDEVISRLLDRLGRSLDVTPRAN